MQNTSPELEPDCFYHIYNRANGSEQLFLSDENYRFFLRKYLHHIEPIINTYCYCLMPNHFHLLVQVKSELEILSYLSDRNKTGEQQEDDTAHRQAASGALPKFKTLEELACGPEELRAKVIPAGNSLEKLISKQFANFFSSYTQAFNKQQKRMGSLFMKNFKRIKVTEDRYFRNLVHYIHYNPVEAGFCNSPAHWEHSSFQDIVSDNKTFLKRDELIDWFDDLENFKLVHHIKPTEKMPETEI